MTTRVLAVDLGAASGRIASIDLEDPTATVEIVHRWPNAPVLRDGSLRWDWSGMVAEIEHGLERALDQDGVVSIGVDGWGVDYGLIDSTGRLVSAPYSYRDRRTENWREVAEAIGFERLYQVSGIQLMGINTIFQLAYHRRRELESADRILLLPDLLVHHLTGFVGAERSNASTTGLLDARHGVWSGELVEAIAIPPGLLAPLVTAGVQAGDWRGVPVHLVGSHDTASAFLGMPGGPETVFVSTGTWVIVGVERPQVDTSAAARTANFSNEAGAHGGIRFLKNVIGFWLLERCRPGWGNPSIESLLGEAVEVGDVTPVFDATHDRFVSPVDMEAEIRDAAGIPVDAPRGVVVRSIVESIAIGVAGVVDELRRMGLGEVSRLVVTGGGARVGLLHRMLERHTGMTVTIGSPEATALGNAVSQGISLGVFPDPAAGRRWVANSPETER